MNETDVREIIVRPLLHELGYQQGTEANIRTEVSFRYGKAFLGRKDPDKDPDLKDLRGRADYICEVVSCGRWVVEVKSPGGGLTTDDAQQAHTYAAHPEVAAVFYLITNGREFRLYKTSFPDKPLLTWKVDETVDRLMVLRNLLGPAAIKKHPYIPLDVGKPLGLGLGSSARIVGGSLLYERHEADTRFFMQATELIQNTRGSVTGVEVLRNSEGQIVAILEIVGPYGDLDAFNKAAGLSLYAFKTSDKYISSHIERPTIFQNLTVAHIPRGTRLPKSPMTPEAIMPFDLGLTAYTQAVGYLDGDRFRGTFEIDYQLKFIGLPQGVPVPDKTALYCEGIFDIAFK